MPTYEIFNFVNHRFSFPPCQLAHCNYLGLVLFHQLLKLVGILNISSAKILTNLDDVCRNVDFFFFKSIFSKKVFGEQTERIF
jgi:hypothetical protein